MNANRKFNEYSIMGEVVRVDVSTQSQPHREMLIDLCDWEYLQRLDMGRISATNHGGQKNVYATASFDQKSIMIHRVLLVSDRPVDHQNHNGLDNRRSNIRLVSHQTNSKNQSMNSRNTSGFTGVNWAKREQMWRARITSDGVEVFLGMFNSKEAAIIARKAANVKYGFHENHGMKIAIVIE